MSYRARVMDRVVYEVGSCYHDDNIHYCMLRRADYTLSAPSSFTAYQSTWVLSRPAMLTVLPSLFAALHIRRSCIEHSTQLIKSDPPKCLKLIAVTTIATVLLTTLVIILTPLYNSSLPFAHRFT
jgi:hypothetical protein